MLLKAEYRELTLPPKGPALVRKRPMVTAKQFIYQMSEDNSQTYCSRPSCNARLFSVFNLGLQFSERSTYAASNSPLSISFRYFTLIN